MENSLDTMLLKVRDKVTSFLKIFTLNVKHVRVMLTALRNIRELNLTSIRKRLQRLIIKMPSRKSVLINFVSML